VHPSAPVCEDAAVGLLILVRHAMPDVRRDVPPTRWDLAEDALDACRRLADAFPRDLAGLVFSSDERKAVATAQAVARQRRLEICIDPRLAEVARPQRWDDDYVSSATAYLRHGARDGWEDQATVLDRFDAAVADAASQAHGGRIVAVTHGLALTLYLASRIDIDRVEFWRRLRFPDAWVVDPAAGLLERATQT
jgi:broad specificity phosphatase PhoE